jgi:hypothetical protein
MNDQIQREPLEKKSPYKRASYAAAVAVTAVVAAPFAFGVNPFAWVASWAIENWPRLIIIAVFAGWMGKSYIKG